MTNKIARGPQPLTRRTDQKQKQKREKKENRQAPRMMGRGARDGAILLSSGMYTSQLNSQRSFSHNAWLARGEGGSPRSVGPPPVVLPQCKCNTTEPNNQQRPTWSDALKETGWMPNTQYEPLASMNYWGTVGDRRRFIVPPPLRSPTAGFFSSFSFSNCVSGGHGRWRAGGSGK